MKREYVIISAAIMAMAAALLLSGSGITAERAEPEPEPVLNAAMRVDVTPLLEKLDALQAEVVRSRTALEQQAQSIEALRESLGSLEKAIAGIKRPEKWEYHFLWQTTSKTAANNLGEEGWELVAVGTNFLVFRRPAQDAAAGEE